MSSDRFMVNRRNLQIDESNYWLHNHNSSTLINDYFERTPVTKQDIHYTGKLHYLKSLRQILNINENRPLLPFNSSGCNSQNEEIKSHWPVNPRTKPMVKPQKAVLDLPGIKNNIQYNVVHWSSNDYIVAALRQNIYLWHVPTSIIAHNLSNICPISALRLDRLGNRMAYAQKTILFGKLIMWDVKKAKEVCSIRGPCDHECFISCIDWHHSNAYLVISCKMGNLALLTPDLKIITLRKKAHGLYAIIRVKFSPHGNYLASSGEDAKINIWTVPQLQIIHQHCEVYMSRGISWHPWRSSYLCYGTFGGKIALMNTSLGKNLYESEDHNTIIYDLSFNRTTAELVTSHAVIESYHNYRYTSQINVLARINRTVDRFIGHTGRILYLEWSPDDTTLASAGTDETIYLWKFMENATKQLKHKKLDFFNFDVLI
ncbi:protein cortex-like [Planococcus citri]|uniref:protein cortex-like n=1 Tax=Planococcus citri TaxID=170843 RepID=UPI0031F97068